MAGIKRLKRVDEFIAQRSYGAIVNRALDLLAIEKDRVLDTLRIRLMRPRPGKAQRHMQVHSHTVLGRSGMIRSAYDHLDRGPRSPARGKSKEPYADRS